MQHLFSNGPNRDFVFNPFAKMVSESNQIDVAAPYVTRTVELLDAAKQGRQVNLLVGINTSTSPDALWAIHEKPYIEVRYYTDLLHAKVFLFDEAALVGSSNLTDPGLQFNREATIHLTEPDDVEAIEELREFFTEIWTPAPVLTTERLARFTEACKRFKPHGNPDRLIGDMVGRAAPPSVRVIDPKHQAKRLFLEGLRRQIADYRMSFNTVQKLLLENHFHRAELAGESMATQTNLFLSWVRLTQAGGDEWKAAPIRSDDDREREILRLSREWTDTADNRVAATFIEWLRTVHGTFGTSDAISNASQEELMKGIMSIHAFNDQFRFVKGGENFLPAVFWRENSNDVVKVQRSLKYLIYGGGEFVERLHDVLYDQRWKLSHIGLSCASELYGTIRPMDHPPVNGRIAKALRYLGFNVRGGMS